MSSVADRSMAAASPELRHVAMLPFMAKGHAMPLLHLTRLLLARGLASKVTFFTTPRDAPFIRASLAGAGAAAVVELPFPTDDGLNDGAAPPQSMDDELASPSQLADVVAASAALRPAFAAAFARLEPRPDVLVHDGFLPWAERAAADAGGVPRLVSYGMSAFATYVAGAVTAHKPHARVGSPSEPFEVDGLAGLRLTRADLNPPFDEPEPTGPLWDLVCKTKASMDSSEGIIVNSFVELEALCFDGWSRMSPVKLWPVGPLCLAFEPGRNMDRDISDWLDSRLAMNRPVLYVAFGSQAELSWTQLEEIALGLDQSGLDFLWVVRSKWFDSDDRFENRFGDKGKVYQGFIDQFGVLSHKSIKGFFSHCGWNSVLESISMGVPILAFPMTAEQKLNAKFVVDVLRVGLRVWPKKREDDMENGLVAREEVQVMVRELIFGEEGKRVSTRVSELAVLSKKAMEIGGSSYTKLEEMVHEISELTRDKSM